MAQKSLWARVFVRGRTAMQIKYSHVVLAAVVMPFVYFSVHAATLLRIGEDEVDLSGPVSAPVDQRYATYLAALLQLPGYQKQRASTTPTPPDPHIFGQWRTLGYSTTARAIHVSLLHNGKVLLASGSDNTVTSFKAGSFTAQVWNPVDRSLVSVPPPWDMFCSGHVIEPDGNVLVMGGTIQYNADGSWQGSNKTYRFNIGTQTWVQRA